MPPKIEISVEPLAVRTRPACQMLGIGLTTLYELIAQKELDSYLDGTARKITVASIKRRIERKLEAAKNAPLRRGGPGRPKKKMIAV